MKYDAELRHRRSIRLRGYDYSRPGAYFVTICALGRECLFGEITGSVMAPNRLGRVCESSWRDLPRHYGHVRLDAFVVMPNHVHGIVILGGDAEVGAGFSARTSVPPPGDLTRDMVRNDSESRKPAPTRHAHQTRHGLPEVVRAFKTFSARRVNALRRTPGAPVWQRNYYEHVIRGEEDLARIRGYIVSNPAKWAKDTENPAGEIDAVPQGRVCGDDGANEPASA